MIYVYIKWPICSKVETTKIKDRVNLIVSGLPHMPQTTSCVRHISFEGSIVTSCVILGK